MTRDDILQLVEEAGFELYMFSSKGRDSFERFANLVAAAERERFVAYPAGDVTGPCVCGSWPGGECLRCDVTDAAAAAIRARDGK